MAYTKMQVSLTKGTLVGTDLPILPVVFTQYISLCQNNRSIISMYTRILGKASFQLSRQVQLCPSNLNDTAFILKDAVSEGDEWAHSLCWL